MNQSKEKIREVNWDRVFGGIASVTFGAQLLSFLILLAAGIVFLLMFSGVWGFFIANPDILIFFLLIVGGFAFLLFIWLLGFFLRFHGRIRRYIIGKGLGHLDTDNPATKTLLTLFAVAILFVVVAAVYGYYLVWKYLLNPWGIAFLSAYGLLGYFIYEFGLLIVFAAFGVILICLIMQILSVLINRYVGRLVSDVS